MASYQANADSQEDSNEESFYFSMKKVTVDWELLSTVDIDNVVSEVDVDVLQRHIDVVTFCDLDGLKCQNCQNPTNPGVKKLLRLAQLLLEWFLYLQEVAATKLIAAETENMKLQRKNSKQKNMMELIAADLLAKNNIVEMQQSLLRIRISGEKVQLR